MATDYQSSSDVSFDVIVASPSDASKVDAPLDASVDASTVEEQSSSASDTLAQGVAFMLIVTVIQKGVGFLRSLLLCRFLSDDELGRWSLAFSFLLLAAPLVVLGLPGVFGRYVEHYRTRGQLRSFLRKTTLVSGVLGAAGVLMVVLCRQPLAGWTFGDPSQTSLVLLLALVMVGVLGFNYLSELLTALRKVRAVSWMQFFQSIVFAGAALTLAACSPWGAAGVAGAYGLGCVAAAVVAVIALRKAAPDFAEDSSHLTGRNLWAKLLPFAAWVWMINLLANLFSAADRYMIVHLASSSSQESQALVGQYHSSLVAPLMFVALAQMFGGILLPYLTQDWEAGRRGEVSRRLNLALKLTSLSFSLLGAVLLALAPWLFHSVFGGKYDDGLEVLPWSLAYCVWFSLATIAQTYLWCAERAWLSSTALAIGLAANLALNYLLMPRFGLHGAVWATAAANALALGLILYFNRRRGAEIDRGTFWVCLLPLTIGAGLVAALLGSSLAILVAWRSHRIFNQRERCILGQLWNDLVQRVRKMIQSSTA